MNFSNTLSKNVGKSKTDLENEKESEEFDVSEVSTRHSSEVEFERQTSKSLAMFSMKDFEKPDHIEEQFTSKDSTSSSFLRVKIP